MSKHTSSAITTETFSGSGTSIDKTVYVSAATWWKTIYENDSYIIYNTEVKTEITEGSASVSVSLNWIDPHTGEYEYTLTGQVHSSSVTIKVIAKIVYYDKTNDLYTEQNDTTQTSVFITHNGYCDRVKPVYDSATYHRFNRIQNPVFYVPYVENSRQANWETYSERRYSYTSGENEISLKEVNLDTLVNAGQILGMNQGGSSTITRTDSSLTITGTTAGTNTFSPSDFCTGKIPSKLLFIGIGGGGSGGNGNWNTSSSGGCGGLSWVGVIDVSSGKAKITGGAGGVPGGGQSAGGDGGETTVTIGDYQLCVFGGNGGIFGSTSGMSVASASWGVKGYYIIDSEGNKTWQARSHPPCFHCLFTAGGGDGGNPGKSGTSGTYCEFGVSILNKNDYKDGYFYLADPNTLNFTSSRNLINWGSNGGGSGNKGGGGGTCAKYTIGFGNSKLEIPSSSGGNGGTESSRNGGAGSGIGAGGGGACWGWGDNPKGGNGSAGFWMIISVPEKDWN